MTKLESIKRTRVAPINRQLSLTVDQWLYIVQSLKDYRDICCEEYFSECHDPEEMVMTEHRKANSLIGQITEHLIDEDNKHD